jgi:hypothetical protein
MGLLLIGRLLVWCEISFLLCWLFFLKLSSGLFMNLTCTDFFIIAIIGVIIVPVSHGWCH